MDDLDAKQGFSFELNAPDFLRDPGPTFAYMRSHAPVYYWESGKAWLLTRYDDVAMVLRDERFTTSPRHWVHAPPPAEGRMGEFHKMIGSGLASASPEGHLRLRSLINPTFSGRAVERMRARTQRVVDELLDAAKKGDVIDVRNDFAEMLPIRVLSSVLGIPEGADAPFRSFALAVIRALDPWRSPEELAQQMITALEGRRLLEELIEQKQRHIADDLLSDLLRAEEAGDRLSHDELFSFVIGLLIAGSDTTVHALCFAVYELLKHPEALSAVRADRSLLKNAIEESLRHNPFMKFGALPRYALEDVELRGVRIRKGERVQVVVSATSLDPAVFPAPEAFDLHRDTTKTLVFGLGPHFCAGAGLARLELHSALSALLDRYSTLALVEEPEFKPHLQMRDMKSLRIRVAP